MRIRLECAALIAMLWTAPASARTLPPWASPDSRAWANESRATWITDMSRCSPSSAFASRMRHGHWKLYPYELLDGRKGVMAWTSPLASAPALRLPLRVHGWYAIFMGLFCGADRSVAWVKLNTDVAPLQRSNSYGEYYGALRDTYFKVAQLHGNETILIAPQSGPVSSACGLGYIKLIPLTPSETAGFVADQRAASTRTMTVADDGFGILNDRPTLEGLLAEVEPFRNSDVHTLIMEQFEGDKMFYPSAAGFKPGMSMDDLPDPGHRSDVEAVRAFEKAGINTLKVLIDGAHNCGLRVHVAIRTGGMSWAPPFDEFWETPFFKQHPEWYCVDRDGAVTTRMSWAVPAVRRHWIEMLRQMVRFGADGVSIDFCRGVPVTLYEPALRNLFRAKYGLDTAGLDDTDPRILAVRSDVVTSFFTELRGMLNEEQKRRGDGKRLQASIMAFGNDYDNSWYGIDIRRLVSAGLLDQIMVYADSTGSRKGTLDYAWFRGICSARGVPWWPSSASTTLRTLNDAADAYDGGAPAVSIFGTVGSDIDEWLPESRMGHREEVRERLRIGLSQDKYYFFHTLGNKVMDGRFPPIWGG